MIFKEIPKDKVDIINSVITGSPNFVSGSPWLSVYPCKPELFFDNPVLLGKTVAAAIVASGAIVVGFPAAIYSFDIIRRDGSCFDIDRYILSSSGTTILQSKKIEKDFLEHHSSGIPYYYQN